jgi:hypothetical protein
MSALRIACLQLMLLALVVGPVLSDGNFEHVVRHAPPKTVLDF